MNKGFFYYMRRSWSITAFAYKRLSFLKKLELTLFLLVCYIGSAIFFLRPIFSIALMNAARMIEETHNLSVSKCFEGITKNSRFVDLLIADLYVFFLILVIGVLCFVPNLAYLLHPDYMGDAGLFILIGTIVIASVFAIIIEFKYLPLPYVASGTINTSAGDMLLNVRNMKGRAVWTEILLIVFFAFLAILLSAAVVGGIIVIDRTLLLDNDVWFWPILGLYVVLVATFFFPFTFFMSALHVSLYELYKDTVSLKKVYVVKELPGNEVGYASIFPTEKDEVEIIKDEKMGGLK